MLQYTLNDAKNEATINGQTLRVVKGFKENTLSIDLKPLNLPANTRKWGVINADELTGEIDPNYSANYVKKLATTLTLDTMANFLSEEDAETFTALLNKAQAEVDKVKEANKAEAELEKARRILAEYEAREKAQRDNIENLKKMVEAAK